MSWSGSLISRWWKHLVKTKHPSPRYECLCVCQRCPGFDSQRLLAFFYFSPHNIQIYLCPGYCPSTLSSFHECVAMLMCVGLNEYYRFTSKTTAWIMFCLFSIIAILYWVIGARHGIGVVGQWGYVVVWPWAVLVWPWAVLVWPWGPLCYCDLELC